MRKRISTGNKAFICKVCDSDFRSYVDGRIYCSRDCMTADYRLRMSGDGNPAWRGGKWKYKGRGWTAIAAAIIERDGRCGDCGGTRDLVAHHRIPQRFYVSLDAANTDDNLVALCHDCHVKRPEHYWIELPAEHFDVALHLPLPPERTRARLKPRPLCLRCATPCKRHRSQYCSVSCATRARWDAGVYVGIAANLGDPATARWGVPKRLRDV